MHRVALRACLSQPDKALCLGLCAGLCAREPNALVPGGLLVAPCFLPNVASGDYWVLAVGTDASGRYTWVRSSPGLPATLAHARLTATRALCWRVACVCTHALSQYGMQYTVHCSSLVDSGAVGQSV